MKLLRRCLLAMVLMFALICVVIVALPDRAIKSLAIHVTHLLTDRELHIGSLDLERGLQPRLTVTNVAFDNAAWASQASLFSADSISAKVDVAALLKGQLVIQDVSSRGVVTHLEVSEDGRNNWQLSSTPMTLPPLSRLTLASVSAYDTLVTFVDRQMGNKQRLLLDDVLLSNDKTDNEPLISVTGEINALPISATLTLQTNMPGKLSVADVLRLPHKLDVTAGDITVAANGRINDDGDALTIESDLSMDIASLAQLGKIINRPLPDLGPVNLNATVSANPELIASTGIRIPDLRLTVADPRLQLEVQGQFTDVPSISKGAASVSLTIPDADSVLAMFNVNRRLPGELTVDATLTGANREYELALHNTEFTSEFIHASLSGTMTDILKTARTDIAVELATPDLSIVTQLFGTNMPPEWGPVTANASLQGESGSYALNNIDATLDGNSKARAKGSIKSLKPFDDMHLDVDVSLHTLKEVSAFTRNPLPDIGPMTGTGVVGWQDGKLFLKNADTRHKSQYGTAVVTGNIGDLIRFDRVRLRADADLPNFAALDLFTGFELPDVDRVTASTNLISANALDLSARQLTVTTIIDGVTVVGKGAVESFIKPHIGVDLELASAVDSLTELDALSGRALPDFGPLQATARLKGKGKDFVLNDINAVLSDSKLSGTVTSQLDDLTAFDKLDFNVSLQTDDIAAVASELGFDSLVSAPAKFATDVRIDGKNLQLNSTDMDIDGNLVSGNLAMLNLFDGQEKTRYRGDVTIDNVDTRTLFAQVATTGQDSTETAENNSPSQAASDKKRLLSDQPLPIDFVRNNDIDVDLKIQNLTTSLLDIADASLNLDVQAGVLKITPFTGMVNEGELDLDLVVDARDTPTSYFIDLSLNEFDLARAMVLDDTELLDSTGGTWADITFSADGESLADILGSATGEGGFYIEDLLFNENVLSIFSSDLLKQLIDALNPFADRQMKGTRLLCSAVLFELRDGVLETPFGFATEAADFAVVGDGQVNFRNENIELMFNSGPKTGLGISLNRLAGLVKLKGPLASPSMTLNEVGLLRFGASVAAAVASGGVTLLAEGLYTKHAAMSDVCAQALGN